ncbi:MAG: Gfo/Idh/MocA family oxidoreductase [Bdellovibrionia bacterium]
MLEPVSRREFIVRTGLVAGTLGLGLAVPETAKAQNIIRVGLVGCGKRGTGAAVNAIQADPSVRVTALADVFADQLASTLGHLTRNFGTQTLVTPATSYVGFDAVQKMLAGPVDLVILATPPHFRASHIDAAIRAGKHVFAEKPAAIDVPGVKKVLEATKLAKEKNLSFVAGLNYRYENAKRETIRQIHDGRIGRIRHLYCAYNKGTWDFTPAKTGWTDMETHIRNYNHYRWLNGDIALDLLVHNLDKISWAMNGELPVKVWGMGGQEVTNLGAGFDHHAIVYEYKNGTRLTAYTRAIANARFEVADMIYGDKGVASLMDNKITGDNPWMFNETVNDSYQTEFNEMIRAIKTGKAINDGEHFAMSAFMGIMGRWASYTGAVLTAEQVWKSTQTLGPAQYQFGPAPQETRAIPGITKMS